MLANALTEREFQRQVTDLAEIFGWEWVHFRPAQTSRGWRTPVSGPLGEGWVDLTLIRRRDRRLVFAELKTTKGVVSPRQAEVLDLLRILEYGRVVCGEGPHERDSAGVERRLSCCWPWIQVAVWRPADLESGAIAEVLQ